MSASSTPEFPPLLPVGFHPTTVAGLRSQCVTPFTLSTTRPLIMSGLEIVHSELVDATVQGELWVDGSFLTEGIDPRDVDLVLKADGDFYDNAAPAQRSRMDWFGSNLRATHFCHSFLLLEYPEGHSFYSVGEWMRAYWIRQFGFSRAGRHKGISVVTL